MWSFIALYVIVICELEAGILDPDKTSMGRQRLYKPFPAEIYMQATAEKLLEAVFSMSTVLTILRRWSYGESWGVVVCAYLGEGRLVSECSLESTRIEREWAVAVGLLPLVEEEILYRNAWKSLKEKYCPRSSQARTTIDFAAEAQWVELVMARMSYLQLVVTCEMLTCQRRRDHGSREISIVACHSKQCLIKTVTYLVFTCGVGICKCVNPWNYYDYL
jgi:hypothetical protein